MHGSKQRKGRDDEHMSRFFINIGRKDKLNPSRLIGLINDQEIGKNIDIGQIEILDTFSFFELDQQYEKETVAAFEKNQVDFGGRQVSVEITKKERSGRGGGHRKGGGKRKKYREGKSDFNGMQFGRKRKGSGGKSAAKRKRKR
jgi:ATP-dependent RNA helicase DeaD